MIIMFILKLSLDPNYLIDADHESEQKMITYVKIHEESVTSFAISLFTCNLHFLSLSEGEEEEVFYSPQADLPVLKLKTNTFV